MPTMRHHVMMEVGPRPVLALYIATNTVDYDVYTAAGSPGVAVNVVLTLNSGIMCSPSVASAGNFGIKQSSAFVAGSTVLFINLGNVYGYGGIGGAGAGGPSYPGSGSPGTSGGTAINILDNWTIDNTYGNIFGGGKGGTGGDSIVNSLFQVANGGDGGGGEGQPGGVSSGNGTSGTRTANGLGGPGGDTGSPRFDQAPYGYDGGTWGDDGKAIALNGKTVTWIGGNNPTQVRGAVS